MSMQKSELLFSPGTTATPMNLRYDVEAWDHHHSNSMLLKYALIGSASGIKSTKILTVFFTHKHFYHIFTCTSHKKTGCMTTGYRGIEKQFWLCNTSATKLPLDPIESGCVIHIMSKSDPVCLCCTAQHPQFTFKNSPLCFSGVEKHV